MAEGADLCHPIRRRDRAWWRLRGRRHGPKRAGTPGPGAPPTPTGELRTGSPRPRARAGRVGLTGVIGYSAGLVRKQYGDLYVPRQRVEHYHRHGVVPDVRFHGTEPVGPGRLFNPRVDFGGGYLRRPGGHVVGDRKGIAVELAQLVVYLGRACAAQAVVELVEQTRAQADDSSSFTFMARPVANSAAAAISALRPAPSRPACCTL